MKKILMIAFHYPPFHGSSGVERNLAFSRYLPEHGWQPIVLSANPRAYEAIDNNRLCQIPKNIVVKRTFALNAARDLSVCGKYFGWMEIPDRWVSWWLSAVLSGLNLIRKQKPDLIWSTYTIATAHLIALTLHKLTGIPWVADIRDPMTFDIRYNIAQSIVRFRTLRWLEAQTVMNSSRVAFTTPGALRMYEKRYPDMPKSHWAVIANGYNEEDFNIIEKGALRKDPREARITLVHSGILYYERNPSAFFSALSDLFAAGRISPSSLNIVLRASYYETHYNKFIKENGLDGIVIIKPQVTHQEAVEEMLSADGLLLFQGSVCNNQIPAKAYEYIRARKPIFALTDPEGDTAGLLKNIGAGIIVPMDSKDKIVQALPEFLESIRSGTAPVASEDDIKIYSRRNSAAELAMLLDEAVKCGHKI